MSRKSAGPGFTLVELQVSLVIFVIILGIIFGLTQQTTKVFRTTSGQMEAFRAARTAFESITRNLSLATLNNYYDYVDSTGKTRAQVIQGGDATTVSTFSPSTYARVSDLHFVSGWNGGSSSLYSKQVTHSVFFQAPLGYSSTGTITSLENVVNACGYYIEYMADSSQPTFVSNTPVYRYRLMEFIQPSEQLTVFTTSDTSWFRNSLIGATPPVHQVAPNVIALLFLPRSSSADALAAGSTDPILNAIPDYNYDTRANTSAAVRHQLPPLLEVVMVAIDEPSAARLQSSGATPPTLIQNALTAANRFKTASRLDDDLRDLEKELTDQHITYRVFRTIIPLRNSKWSRQ
ncbi:MAG: Verru_Chthon cassette protein C [Candidatus Methylacidiphilales bacterium]|nr:Verru_Chthon cassette protein C [Candidatus Methylacidiphilales bacterium]